MTAWANIQLVVEAMRRGARDFVEKPWDNSRLLSTIRRQAHARSAEQLTAREEMRDAVTTQHALLPKKIPSVLGCDIPVAWEPVRGGRGDYLGVIRAGGERL